MFSRDKISNIFVSIKLKNVYRVTHDSAKQDDFVAYMEKQKVNF